MSLLIQALLTLLALGLFGWLCGCGADRWLTKRYEGYLPRRKK